MCILQVKTTDKRVVVEQLCIECPVSHGGVMQAPTNGQAGSQQHWFDQHPNPFRCHHCAPHATRPHRLQQRWLPLCSSAPSLNGRACSHTIHIMTQQKAHIARCTTQHSPARSALHPRRAAMRPCAGPGTAPFSTAASTVYINRTQQTSIEAASRHQYYVTYYDASFVDCYHVW